MQRVCQIGLINKEALKMNNLLKILCTVSATLQRLVLEGNPVIVILLLPQVVDYIYYVIIIIYIIIIYII